MPILKILGIISSIIFLSTSVLAEEKRLSSGKLSSQDVTSDSYKEMPLKISPLYGIGAKASLGTSSSTAIYFPIITSPIFQYEPEFQHQRTTISETISNGSSTVSNLEYISEWMSIGVGIIKRRRDADLSINSGIRLGLIRAVQYNQNNNGTVDLQGWGYYIAPLLAGEYYIAPHLSLTGEAQYHLAAIKLTGEMTISSTSGDKTYKDTRNELILGSRFLFILKWYLP